jgi:hypothetical protein
VRYWVAQVREETTLNLQKSEVADARWCSWEDAENMISFPKGKDLLNLVKALLDGSGGASGIIPD